MIKRALNETNNFTFEDHRDPCAKEIVCQHLEKLQLLNVNTLALEIDKGISLEKHFVDVRKFYQFWSNMNSISSFEKENILNSVSEARKMEFHHNIAYLPSRKAELALLFKVKQMGTAFNCQGIDSILREARTLTPQQQLEIAIALQAKREKSMVDNLVELNMEDGIIAILGLSHFEVATQLKQKGHDVFCFLPLSINLEDSIRNQFLNKIEQHDASVKELILLDQRTQPMNEIWDIITSTFHQIEQNFNLQH